MEQYDRLISGLGEKSVHWWRAQLERLQYATEIYKANAKGLKSMVLQVRVLTYKDKDMGGYWKQFSEIEGQANAALKAMGGSSPPAATTAKSAVADGF